MHVAGFEHEKRQMDTACGLLLGVLGPGEMQSVGWRTRPLTAHLGYAHLGISPQAEAGCAQQMQHSLRRSGPDQGRGFLLQR